LQLFHQKPAGGSELIAHLSKYCQSHEIAVVGDRLLTDIVYGSQIGAFTILTKDIVTEKGDNWFAVRVSSLLCCRVQELKLLCGS
jgi:phosphatidylglycerophosphatase GEP4